MRLTVLGGSGAWPAAGGACSGYLVEQDGFRLLVDPGYGTLPRLLELLPVHAPAGALDPVLALDAAMLRGSYAVHDLAVTRSLGPFAVRTAELPHVVPNLGVRLDGLSPASPSRSADSGRVAVGDCR